MTDYWRFLVKLHQFLLSNAVLLSHRHDLALNFGEIGYGRNSAVVKIGILPELCLGLFLLLLLLIILVLMYPLRLGYLIAGNFLHLRYVRSNGLISGWISSGDVRQDGLPLLGGALANSGNGAAAAASAHQQGLGDALLELLRHSSAPAAMY